MRNAILELASDLNHLMALGKKVGCPHYVIDDLAGFAAVELVKVANRQEIPSFDASKGTEQAYAATIAVRIMLLWSPRMTSVSGYKNGPYPTSLIEESASYEISNDQDAAHKIKIVYRCIEAGMRSESPVVRRAHRVFWVYVQATEEGNRVSYKELAKNEGVSVAAITNDIHRTRAKIQGVIDEDPSFTPEISKRSAT